MQQIQHRVGGARWEGWQRGSAGSVAVGRRWYNPISSVVRQCYSEKAKSKYYYYFCCWTNQRLTRVRLRHR